MDFLDEEAETSSDILVPSSQPEQLSQPRKRRRLDSDEDPTSPIGEDEYDLPSPEGTDEKENKKSKYEDRIHVPTGEKQLDTFVTQLTQQYSSPSRIRGPRWMKPRKTPAPSQPRSAAQRRSSTSNPQPQPSRDLDDEFEVDDELELLAAFEAESSVSRSFGNLDDLNSGPPGRQSLQKTTSFRQTTLHGINTTQQEPPKTQTQARVHNWPLMNRDEAPTHHDIDRSAMATWIYPTNLGRIRDYQYNIVHKGLFHNLLVALPTGLGKTFIAATIMLNWYRWTKTAQMVFVAPTKPLVSQQIDACFNIAGIPRSHTTMLTGEVAPAIRAEEWQKKRVFFMTPQTLVNDLKHGYCDPKKIVLIVVDEAHKATGSYAYVEVVKFMRRFNSSFRILALTATPGKDVETVQEVIDGLGVARVEIRTEESLDIRDFVHSRNIQTEIFDNSDEMTMVLESLSSTLQPLLNQLHGQGAAWGKDPTRITLFGLKTSWEKWQSSEAGRRAAPAVKGMIRSISATLMSLAHNIELLKYHGIGPFFHKMKLFVQEANSAKKAKYPKLIADNANFKRLMDRLALWANNPDFEGHPKLSYLKRVVLNHFMDAGGESAARASNTRIMVFSHYRDSAEEIVRVLNRHGPMIRAHVFVGQSGTKGGSEGMNQKKQLDIIQKFKAGTYNTIVATSIGEEGLDIGEVDMIVCYDCSKSPIRMLQRMGRTGRKRAGNIVVLMMRGKEEEGFKQAEDNYQKMQAKIAKGTEFSFHDDLSPRIVPREIDPKVDKRVVEIPIENTQGGSVEPSRSKARNAKKPPKKFHMPDGVETGFAFLGKGSEKASSKPRAKKPTKTKREDEMAPLPPLEDVLLSTSEQRQLEDCYTRLAGTVDEDIKFIRFDAFPEQQRRLGKTGYVKHSGGTKSLVKAFKAMNDPAREWTRPVECAEFSDEELHSSSDIDRDVSIAKPSGEKSNPKPHKAHKATSGRKATLAPARTKVKPKSKPTSLPDHSSEPPHSSSTNQYDDQDSFIDDTLSTSSLPQRTSASAPTLKDLDDLDDLLSIASLPSQPATSPPPTAKPQTSTSKLPAHFFLSQESVDYEAMNRELPDLEDLFSSVKKVTEKGKGIGEQQGGKGALGDEASSPVIVGVRGSVREKTNSKEKQKEKKKTLGAGGDVRQRARRVLDSDDEDDI